MALWKSHSKSNKQLPYHHLPIYTSWDLGASLLNEIALQREKIFLYNYLTFSVFFVHLSDQQIDTSLKSDLKVQSASNDSYLLGMAFNLENTDGEGNSCKSQQGPIYNCPRRNLKKEIDSRDLVWVGGRVHIFY